MCFPDVDIGTVGTTTVAAEDGSGSVIVDVIDAVADHVALLKTVFDFEAIKALATHPEFSIVYDCMHGVQGPYAKACLVDELGFPESSLMNAEPKDDFAGHHADPNLTYAAELTVKMGVDKAGQPVEGQDAEPPCFGAAADGDADRNMILGRRFFCSPSDSLAVIAAHANCIPYFRDQGGLKTVARSMPTSGAVDLVAKRLNFNLFETPVCGPRTPPACSARGQSLLGY
jgi:phosphoglucomutase|eukprot:COSAG01_NODE_3781_length_5700_cov_10.714872_3_plen_229_part_00